MNETRSKEFSETWDGAPNVEGLPSPAAEQQVSEATAPMGAEAFEALLAGLGQRVAALATAQALPVAETVPVQPAVPEQPVKALHEMDSEEFRTHVIGHWQGMTDGQDARRPAPPITVSQYLAAGE